ncbi:hypothetical protein K493DRAFT_380142 [Basidiobolus meristosporus CBS 931.73]|uniref:Uncharacterized protein n=1 Tax=Basidiobolus meristosporus CBS 931.73 TaxID=1314790 RepID=A0A1Y1XYE6_9FUNG|nr:hypothetical protein K493DRAFT_380142 [Basidiobolus meristosporus CBS 931.73]|eukprot:ORX90777.1 hypothetical protein K493DRAFT_380142 [Basidiobolus meristosporus CBS 931.73]
MRLGVFFVATTGLYRLASTLPTSNSTDLVGTTALLKDDEPGKIGTSVPYLQLSLSIITPIIALLACVYFTWKKWRQINETKRRVKLAIRNYLANDREQSTNNNGNSDGPPEYVRRSSQPSLPPQMVKQIDEVVYGRISSTIERPPVNLAQQEELPEYSDGTVTATSSDTVIPQVIDQPVYPNGETASLRTA